jgi:hypothetical protein
MESHSKYELAVETRDPEYYEYVRPYVLTMPDLLAESMQTSVGKRSVRSRAWDNEAKWKAIYLDLETLDMASSRGEEGEFDVNFIDAISEGTDYQDIDAKVSSHTKSEVGRFFETYPYLSYVMIKADTSLNMAHYALLAGKLSWIDNSMLDLMANNMNKMIKYIPDYSTAVILNERYNMVSRSSEWFTYRNFALTWPLGVIQLARKLNMISKGLVIYYLLKTLKLPGGVSPDIIDALLGGRTARFFDLMTDESEDMLIAFESAIKMGNSENVKYLLDNYPDIVYSDIPSRLLTRIANIDPDFAEYLRKFIIKRELPTSTKGD